MLHRILDDAHKAEQHLDDGRATQYRVEFRPLAELELFDDFAGEVARQDELHLACHRLLIDGALRSIDFSASGRKKMFSRVSISTRASDL